MLVWDKQHDLGVAELEKAVSLDPNSAEAYAVLGMVLNYSGRPEEATGFIKKAMRLDPKYGHWFALYLGDSYYFLERYDDAIASYQEAVRRSSHYLTARHRLVAAYMHQDRENEAQVQATEVLRINPRFSLDMLQDRLPFRNRAFLDRYIEALRRAGLK